VSARDRRAGLRVDARLAARSERCLARQSRYAGYGSLAASPPVTVCHSPLPHDGQGEGVWWSRRRFDCRTSRSWSRLRSSSSLLSRSRSGRRCANSGATRDRSACSVLSALPGEPPFFALVCVSVWRSQLGEDEGEAKSRAKGPPPRLHAPSLEQGVHRANLRLSTGYTCPQRCAVRRGGRVAVRRAATGRSDVTGESAPEEPPETGPPRGRGD
jgi:hypothetical protein